MQVILETDEAWSVMMLVLSQVLDQVELSDEAKKSIRNWRSDRADGTSEMSDLTLTMNEALGTRMDERTTRSIRRKGWYVSSREEA
jgi:hypothetical protein